MPSDPTKGEMNQINETPVVDTLKEPKSRVWVSQGSDRDMEDEQIKLKRDIIAVRATRKRKEFGLQCTFSDGNAMETFNSGQMECRSFKDPSYDKFVMEQDVATQAIPAQKDSGCQTIQEIPRNSCIQYKPLDIEEDAKEKLLQSEEMCSFLKSAKPKYTDALQQNEIMDLFQDDFANLGDNEEHIGQKSISVITEYQSFSDLVYSKGKMISAIDWMPEKKGIVAAACSESKSYDERLQTSGRPSSFNVLIWSFADPIHPQIILESAFDVFSLRFNPSNPSLIAGGCYSGQVILWDITVALESMERKQKEEDKDKHKKKKAPTLSCVLLSSAATSHNALVSDLHWLPDDLQIGQNGKFEKGHSQKRNILISVAADGNVTFWDITIKKQDPNLEDDRKCAAAVFEKYRWNPIIQISPTSNDPSKYIGILKMTFSNDTKFFFSTEFGEVARANLSSPNNNCLIENIMEAHFGQVRSLQRSPFFEDILLSVDIWTFALWREGFKKPIFISRSAEGYLTTGCWSPSRPGVLYIGRIDGSIEVWDLLDHSHQPSTTASIGSWQVTSMEFYNDGGRDSSRASQQLLAVGDIQGFLHIMEIPRRLRRIVHKEKTMISKLFDRQQGWVEDIETREKFRMDEIERRRQQEASTKEREEQLKKCCAWDDEKENDYRRFEQECKLKFGNDDTLKRTSTLLKVQN